MSRVRVPSSTPTKTLVFPCEFQGFFVFQTELLPATDLRRIGVLFGLLFFFCS